jgi:hypothetical protein
MEIDKFESLLFGVQNVYECGVEISKEKDETVEENKRDPKQCLVFNDFSIEKIARLFNLSIERVNELKNEVENELDND